MHKKTAEREDTTHCRIRKATERLLAFLKHHHDYSVPLPPPKIIPVVEVAPEPVDVPAIQNERISVDTIKRVVCLQFGISHDDIISDFRGKQVTYPRHIAMYLCREKMDISFPQIARRFGGKDHTSVLHGVKKIAALIKNDLKVAHDVAQIEARL